MLLGEKKRIEMTSRRAAGHRCCHLEERTHLPQTGMRGLETEELKRGYKEKGADQ